MKSIYTILGLSVVVAGCATPSSGLLGGTSSSPSGIASGASQKQSQNALSVDDFTPIDASHTKETDTQKIFSISKPDSWTIKIVVPKFPDTTEVGKAANAAVSKEAAKMFHYNVARDEHDAAEHDAKDPYHDDWKETISAKIVQPDLVTYSTAIWIQSEGIKDSANDVQDFTSIGLVNGQARALKIEDLFMPNVNADQIVIKALTAWFSKQNNYDESTAKKLADAEFKTEGGLSNFEIQNDKLIIHIREGLATENSQDKFDVPLNYKDLTGLNPQGPLASFLK